MADNPTRQLDAAVSSENKTFNPFLEPKEPACLGSGCGWRAKLGVAPGLARPGPHEPGHSADPNFGGGIGNGRTTEKQSQFRTPTGGSVPGRTVAGPNNLVAPEAPGWKPPKSAAKWTDDQPKDGFGTPTGPKTDLSEAVKDKQRAQLARERQTGSWQYVGLASGFITGVGTPPLFAALDRKSDKWVLNPPGTPKYKVGNWYQDTFTEKGWARKMGQEEQVRKQGALDTFNTAFDRDVKVLDYIDKRRAGTPVTALTAGEEQHVANLSDAMRLRNPLRTTATRADIDRFGSILKERQTHLFDAGTVHVGGTPTLRPMALKSMSAKNIELALRDRASALRLPTLATVEERQALRMHGNASAEISRLYEIETQALARGKTPWFTKEAFKAGALNGGLASLALQTDRSRRDSQYGMGAKSWESTSLTVPWALMAEVKNVTNVAGVVKEEIALLKSLGVKGALLGGALYLGDVFDGHTPYLKEHIPDWYDNGAKKLRPFTLVDGGLLGGAFAAPIPSKSKLARFALVTASVPIAKFFDATLLGPTSGDKEDSAMNEILRDNGIRTYDSMEQTVGKLKEFAVKNVGLFDYDLREFNSKVRADETAQDDGKPRMSDADKLDAYRRLMMEFRAYGEYNLERGTVLSVRKADGGAMYVLDGLNLDMGGAARMDLRTAQVYVDKAKEKTQGLMDKDQSVNGKKVTKQELDDLNKEGVKIAASIEAIEGKHDITTAFEKLQEFKAWGRTSPDSPAILADMDELYRATFYEDIDTRIKINLDWAYPNNSYKDVKSMILNVDKDKTESRKIIAKMLRGKALAQMADANVKLKGNGIGADQLLWGTNEGRTEEGLYERGKDKNNHGYAKQIVDQYGQPLPKGYDGAYDMLEMAARLDPENKDMPELTALFKYVADKVPEAVRAQYQNFDILNVAQLLPERSLSTLPRIPGGINPPR